MDRNSGNSMISAAFFTQTTQIPQPELNSACV
jgi:hypothetical protein